MGTARRLVVEGEGLMVGVGGGPAGEPQPLACPQCDTTRGDAALAPRTIDIVAARGEGVCVESESTQQSVFAHRRTPNNNNNV